MALTIFYHFDKFTKYSPVAQLAEQVAVNHWVRGSNPRGGVKNGTVRWITFGQSFFIL